MKSSTDGGSSESDNSYPLRKLPLLDFTLSLFQEIDLSNTYIICAQHLASTTHALFNMLLKLGLKAHNLSVIGKCYSSDPEVYRELSKMGIDVCSSSLVFDSHRSFDEQYRENIWKFISMRKDKLADDKIKTIIILDDGGELILAINPRLNNNKRLIGIEQTSSGYHKLKKETISIPVINVARSFLKIDYESPIIARLFLETLTRQLKILSIHSKQALIIGKGAIGSQIYEALRHTHQVSFYDIDSSKTTIKSEDLKDAIKNFDLVIGCTGTTILDSSFYPLLKKNAVLMSASSSDREFDAVSLRRKIPSVSSCHENIYVDNIYLMNCGFPINFSSEYRAIDSDDLDLTRSLLLLAILQAQQGKDFNQSGFVKLAEDKQKDILQKYLSLYSMNAQNLN